MSWTSIARACRQGHGLSRRGRRSHLDKLAQELAGLGDEGGEGLLDGGAEAFKGNIARYFHSLLALSVFVETVCRGESPP